MISGVTCYKLPHPSPVSHFNVKRTLTNKRLNITSQGLFTWRWGSGDPTVGEVRFGGSPQLSYASRCQHSPIQDFVHPDDHAQPTYELTPGFKAFTNIRLTPHSRQSLKLSKSCLVKQGFNLFSSRKCLLFFFLWPVQLCFSFCLRSYFLKPILIVMFSCVSS